MRKYLAIPLLLFLIFVTLPAHAAQPVPQDSAALSGLKRGKAFFDISLNDPLKLPLYLGVIKETFDSLKAQKVKPDFVVAFRGTAVMLVSTERANFTAEQKQALHTADALIKELTKNGVRFEACAVATRLFDVDNAQIESGVKLVGNTFISSIGYQAKGYALIPIQ